MKDSGNKIVELKCPGCGARLRIDTTLRRVVAHESAPGRDNAPDLDRAGQLLEDQAKRREALFRRSAEKEKVKSQLLEQKFEAALKKTRKEPRDKVLRDIDLD